MLHRGRHLSVSEKTVAVKEVHLGWRHCFKSRVPYWQSHDPDSHVQQVQNRGRHLSMSEKTMVVLKVPGRGATITSGSRASTRNRVTLSGLSWIPSSSTFSPYSSAARRLAIAPTSLRVKAVGGRVISRSCWRFSRRPQLFEVCCYFDVRARVDGGSGILCKQDMQVCKEIVSSQYNDPQTLGKAPTSACTPRLQQHGGASGSA